MKESTLDSLDTSASPASLDLRARAETVMARCHALDRFSEESGRLTRRYGTPALRAAQDEVAGWMIGAGMSVHRDAVGNLFGRYPASAEDAPALLIGSHLDSVSDAGRFDGPLGVICAVSAVEALHAADVRLDHAIEVAAFADEEGVRFGSAYLGSRTVTGDLGERDLALTDRDGVSFAEAIRTFGGDPDGVAASRREPADLLGYLEVHIEQGPELEARRLPVGVVSAIVGFTRVAVEFTGHAGHAGTVPMGRRRDALVAAAAFVLAAESIAAAEPGAVATVGELTVSPGAGNVVPGAVRLSLDLRHPDDATRLRLRDQLETEARAIGAAREIGVGWRPAYDNPAVPADAAMAGRLEAAIAALGVPVHRLPSGAGHDAAALSAIVPAAMLFVRCAGGISHHPAESVAVDDIAVALGVLDRAIAGPFGS